MAIRITQNAISRTMQGDVQSIYAKMSKSMQQSTDGKRITKASDDPYGTGQVLGFDTQLSDVRKYQDSVRDATGLMDAADSALDTVGSALQQIRTKALQARNDTNSLLDRGAIAQEITQLKEVVRQAMNSEHGGQFIFAGTGGSTPFPAGVNTYAGTGNSMMKRVGPGQTLAVNVPGSSVLGPNGANALDVIDTLIADITGGNGAGMDAGIAAMTTQVDMALSQRTQLGATAARLEVAGERLGSMEERLISARSEVADVDATEAYMQFTQQQTMYQAALAAGTRMMQTSILDFL